MTNFEMLSEEELMDVNGGGWFKDAWNATRDWCEEHKKALIITGCTAGGIILAATGIGAGVAVGLVAVGSTTAGVTAATVVGGMAGMVTGAVIANK